MFNSILLLALSGPCTADTIRLAVASNFLGPIKALSAQFEQASGHKVLISAGSTGKLYAQIVNGAPFDIFLAANSREPRRLELEGRTGADSRYTYALGVLALWVPDTAPASGNEARSAFDACDGRIAIANPNTAPYGEAAQAVLAAWEQADRLRGRIIRGENIAQAYQFTASGNAACGMVALSQLLNPSHPPDGGYWRIDSALYPPIRQQLVLLSRAVDKPAAVALWRYLKSAPVKQRIADFGYGVE